jgi:wyosine [tRNA(Phe)-imidazoG37] synthetase (radical SAM superfamily)
MPFQGLSNQGFEVPAFVPVNSPFDGQDFLGYIAHRQEGKMINDLDSPEINFTVQGILNSAIVRDDQRRKLLSVWRELQEDEALPNYPFPAAHGRRHVAQVLSNMNDLLPLSQSNDLEPDAVFEILFATMLHDLGMYDMIDKGAYADDAHLSRRNHASWTRLSAYADSVANFKRLNHDVKHRILLMAYAHAGDDDQCLSRKTECLREFLLQHPRESHVLIGALALRLADLIDIGPGRIVTRHALVNWHDPQRHHIVKHKYISANIQRVDRVIIIMPHLDKLHDDLNTSDLYSSFLDSRMEVLALYRCLHEEAQAHISALHLEWRMNSHPMPSLRSIDDALFGSVFPLGSGINLFSMQYRSALDDFFTQRQTNSVFQIDTMGHSQYGRFVSNTEQLNTELQQLIFDKTPGATAVDLRILLLDPEMENQQMEEVYDAQLQSEASAGRSILPRYDARWEIPEPAKDCGDIWATIKEIERWAENLGPNIRLELRLTRRLMYAAMTRFGNRMMVSPYQAGGRFQAAPALRLTPKAALFDSYLREFDALWEHPLQTRIHLLKNPRSRENPISKCISSKGSHVAQEVRHFQYELSLIQDLPRIDYLLSILKSSDGPLPPPEIEIQPSAVCALSCEHCIGAYLGRSAKRASSAWASSDMGQSDFLKWERADGAMLNMKSVFEYEANDSLGHTRRVETVRISGLSGDPLEIGARDFTLSLISLAKQAERKVVLFTNGIALSEVEVRNEIVNKLGPNDSPDAIHVSLDAARADTFESLKRGKSERYGELTKGIADTVHRIKREKRKVQITLGFVVTQLNAIELFKESIPLARSLGVDAVRFKPDIRMPRSLSLRTWSEFAKGIQEQAIKSDGPPWIALTDISPGSSAPFVSEKCWAQYYCPTISPDGFLCICDHVTGHTGEARLGSLYDKPFETIWRESWDAIGRRRSCCFLCPPSKSRLNRFLSELHAIYKHAPYSRMKEWLMESNLVLGKELL